MCPIYSCMSLLCEIPTLCGQGAWLYVGRNHGFMGTTFILCYIYIYCNHTPELLVTTYFAAVVKAYYFSDKSYFNSQGTIKIIYHATICDVRFFLHSTSICQRRCHQKHPVFDFSLSTLRKPPPPGSGLASSASGTGLGRSGTGIARSGSGTGLERS